MPTLPKLIQHLQSRKANVFPTKAELRDLVQDNETGRKSESRDEVKKSPRPSAEAYTPDSPMESMEVTQSSTDVDQQLGRKWF